MKQKARSASGSSRDAGFWIAIFLCLAAAALNSFFFCSSFFRSVAKFSEEPVATVSYKYRTARRKFLNRVVWDRLQQDSPVYNGDTIHTARASEATIQFADGNVMELSENTMVQIFVGGDRTLRASLSEGSALIDASASERGMSLSSAGVAVSVQSGSAVNARSAPAGGGGDGVSIQVFKGAASVSAQDGTTVSVEQGGAVHMDSAGASALPLVVSSPPPNERIMYHTEGAAAVRFAWSAEISDFSTGIVFERASDRSFEAVVSKRMVTHLPEFAEECTPGTWWWRLYAVHGAVADFDSAVVGKISVVRSLPPVLAAPAQGSACAFRSRRPSVRFIWSESERASSYRLVVADNPALLDPAVDQRQNSASAVISSLDAGTWWWQVTPYYAFNGIGFEAPSAVGQFQIARKDALPVPVLFVPQNNSVVNAGGGKSILFSWKMEAEAASCGLLVADNPQLERPIVDVQTTENCYALDAGRLNLRDGTYYWGVSYKDSEGFRSEQSAVNLFLAVRDAPEQRAVEPAYGYRVARSLVQDIVFSWKSSLPDGFESRMQIARDEAFSELVYDGAAAGTSVKGVDLGVGEYWWRLKSSYGSAEGGADGMVLETPARLLRVSDNLDKAGLVQPLGRAVARASVPSAFRWTAVDGADFYTFSLFRAGRGEPVYEESVFGTEASVDLYGGRFEDRAVYRWEVRARANSIPGVQSRLSGRCAEAEFQLVKLRPVEITAPKKNAAVDGVSAVLRPVVARWEAVDAVRSAVFTLRRTDVAPPQVVLRVPSDEDSAAGSRIAPHDVVLDTEEGLRPGTYEIIVQAVTEDGIDISNTDEANVGRFTVLPVKPLDAPSGFTASPELLDAAWLSNPGNHRGIRFSWNAVDGATDYFFSIESGGRRIFEKNVGGSCAFALDFADIPAEDRGRFMNGVFTAAVEAERRIDRDGDGKAEAVLQEGAAAAVGFTTAVPLPKKAEGGNASNLYGR